MLYRRENPLTIKQAKRFAATAIKKRQHFAFSFEGRKVYVVGPAGSEAEIEEIANVSMDTNTHSVSERASEDDEG